MSNALLLPPNRTALESALANINALDLDATQLRSLADSVRCPDIFLPFLAWAWSVENLDGDISAETLRKLIRSSVYVHKHKGTVASIRQAFRDLDLGEISLFEGAHQFFYNSAVEYNGFATYGDSRCWAEYWVKIDKLLDIKQAARARALLKSVAPARCHLIGVDFTGAALIYNAIAAFDGNYSYGVA